MRKRGTLSIIALFVVAILLALSAAACSSPDDPGNKHADKCRATGGTIHHNTLYGGKYWTYTYWCKRPDGLISDVWWN